ncbi:MAG TPA: hypothetical protein VK689_03475 [Armatimonadota bacterium]|nr:hypothetical protein [Armatimonadota bacterium]
MRGFVHVCVLAIVPLALSVAAAPPAPATGPFANVPRSHRAYRIVDHLDRQGLFTGYGDGTFSGDQLRSRYEFAVSIQRMLTEIQRLRAPGSNTVEAKLRQAVRRKFEPLERQVEMPELLLNLVVEFRPEMAMVGADVERVEKNLRLMMQRPEEPGLPPRPANERPDRLAGATLAREEWERGAVTLLGYGFGRATLTLDDLLGIPTTASGGCMIDSRFVNIASGHDEEVLRLCLERGLPPNSLQAWRSIIMRPEEFWKRPKTATVKLHPSSSGVALPVGNASLQLIRGEPQHPPTLAVKTPGQTLRFDLHGLSSSLPYAEALPGPRPSHLLFVRFRYERGAGTEMRYLVVCLRTGRLLNRQTLRLAAVLP